MHSFLIDKEKVYSYDELINSVNKTRHYYPVLKSSNVYDYFTNIVVALLSNNPLTLIDSDIKVGEINGVNEEDINQAIPVELNNVQTIDEIIDQLLKSDSPITIFTSGTTGQPKKVIHTVKSLTRSVRKSDAYSGHVWAFAYNPTHMAGLQVFFQAFCNANKIVYIFNQTRTDVYKEIKHHGITHISATPTFYRLLLPATEELLSVKRVTLGGEKSDQSLYKMIEQIFPNAKINNIYASTEAGSLFAAKGDYFQIPSSIKDFFKVVDGELLIHRTLLGESDSFSFDNDYYHSGDLIEWIDEEKKLFKFHSRKNELINVGGYKVNPNEIETLIQQINGVKQSLVFGRKNSILGNIVCAEVVKAENSLITESEIRAFLTDQLQEFKVPRIIKFVDSFSLTRTGKIKRS